MQAYLPFSGTSEDISEKGNHGLINGALFGNDYFNNPERAVYFDGDNDHIVINHSDSLDYEVGDPFSICLWFKAEDNPQVTAMDLISKWNSALLNDPYSYTIRMGTSNSNIEGRVSIARYDGDNFDCNQAVVIRSDESFLDEEWHFVVFQANTNNQLELYIDSELVGSVQDESICTLKSNSDIILGARTNVNMGSTQPYKGALDELRFYNRALTTDEIIELFEVKSTSNIINIDQNNLNIHPNPSNGIISISNSEIRNTKIFDHTGKHIGSFYGNTYDFNSKKGLFLLLIETIEGDLESHKVLIL